MIRNLLKKLIFARAGVTREFTFIRPQFIECPTCAAKPGSPTLCFECLERRELHGLVGRLGLLPENRK